MSLERTRELYRSTRAWVQGREAHERTLELIGDALSEQLAQKHDSAQQKLSHGLPMFDVFAGNNEFF